MNDDFASWLNTQRRLIAVYGPQYDTDEALQEAWELTRRAGPPNCWTGDMGTLAAAVVGLIAEVDRLRRELSDASP